MTVPAADPPQELVSSWLQYGHYAPPADATKSPFRNEARSESDYARHSIQQSSITATSEPESEPRHEPEPEPEPAQIPSHADQKSLISRSSDYKPTALRWWYHAILIVCLAVLIGLTEYALHTLNVHQDGLDDFVSDQMAAKRSVIRDSRALQQAHVEPRDNVPPSAMDRNSAADRLGSLNFMHPDLVRAASLGNPIQSRGTPAHTRSCEPCDEVLQDSAPREEYLDPGQETLYVYEQKRTVTTTSQTFQHAPSTAGVLQQPTGMTTAEALPAVARKEWYLNPGPETVYETVFLLKRTSTALPATANSEPAALAALYRDGDFGTEGHAVEGLYLDPSRVTTQYLIPRDLQTTATDLSATHTGTSLVTKDNVNDPDTGYTKQDNQPLSNVLSHDTSTSNAGSSSSHLPTGKFQNGDQPLQSSAVGQAVHESITTIDLPQSGQSTGSEKQPLLAPIAEPKGFARAMPSVHAGESLNNPEKYVKLGEETIVWHGKRATQPASTVESTIALPVMTPTWEQYVADGVIALLSSSVFHPETSLIVSTIGQRTALESALATATIGGMSQESATLTEPNAFLTTGKTTIQVTVEASSTVSTTSDVVPAAPSGESLSTGESTMRIDTETSMYESTDPGAFLNIGKTSSLNSIRTSFSIQPTTTDSSFLAKYTSGDASLGSSASTSDRALLSILVPLTSHKGTQMTTIDTVSALPSSPVISILDGESATGVKSVSFAYTTASPSSSAPTLSAASVPNPALLSNLQSHTSALPIVVPVSVTGGSLSFTSTYTDAQGNVETKIYPTASSVSSTAGVASSRATASSGLKPDKTSAPDSGVGGNITASSQVVTVVYGVTLKEYVVGAFLPTFIAVLISFPIKLIGINARLMQPFHALATSERTHGAQAAASIFLRFYSWSGLTSFLRAIWIGQPIIAISDLLVLGSGLLAPLAAETITVYEAIDTCVYECKGNLGSSVVSGRVLQGFLGGMIALLLVLVFLLSVRQWRTGLSHNPWSIAGMASLCYDPKLRGLIKTMRPGKESAMLQLLSDSRYGLGDTADPPESSSSNGRYGIMVSGRADAPSPCATTTDTCSDYWKEPRLDNGNNNKQPFMLLTWWGRCVLLFIFASMLIIVVYYQATSGNTGFERFMDSQSYGVKFFFTALGVILGYCMETIFRCVAIISPYLKLRDEPLIADRSIILSPPTNAFYGIWSAYKQRHLYFGFLSSVTLLAELGLPVTLSHVPFSATETYLTGVVCAWATVAILGLMIISIIWSFFIRWPHMPVDPRTIAGALFYVCDSWMLESLEGMSTLSKDARNRSVRFMGHKYDYGMIHGMSGKGRVGFDVVDVDGKDEESADGGGGVVVGQAPQPQYVWVL